MRNGVQMLHDHMRTGVLLDAAVRDFLAGSRVRLAFKCTFGNVTVNDSDVWVLLALTGRLDQGRDTSDDPKSPGDLGSQLGFGRERTTQRLRSLVQQKLVRFIGSGDGTDKQKRFYVLEATGKTLSAWLFEELAAIEVSIRRLGGIKANAHMLDVQKLIVGLANGDHDSKATRWLDKRRTNKR